MDEDGKPRRNASVQISSSLSAGPQGMGMRGHPLTGSWWGGGGERGCQRWGGRPGGGAWGQGAQGQGGRDNYEQRQVTRRAVYADEADL